MPGTYILASHLFFGSIFLLFLVSKMESSLHFSFYCHFINGHYLCTIKIIIIKILINI